jgi:asparagine synthetase B (glutamine-hydrolysing)
MNASHHAPISIRLGGLRLDVRRAVALHDLTLADGTAFYLSLYEGEIEARLERCLDAHRRGGGAFECVADVAAAAAQLEPTDAIVAHARDGRIVIARGGCCTFPLYWQRGASECRVSTALPLLEGQPFAAGGLVAAVAAVSLYSSYEPNAWLETPLLGWQRVRRGAVTLLDGDSPPRETPILHVGAGVPEHDAVADGVRSAFEAYGRSQADVRDSVVELSGGFDSTLAAAAALGPSHRMLAVSAAFPYYEFRFEEGVQRAVADALCVPRTVLDGTQLFPYSPPARAARFDEPAVFVTGLRHAERVAEFAAESGATIVYNGHGGDQLFCTDLTAVEALAPTLPARGPFSAAAWAVVSAAIARIRRAEWRPRAAATFVYDARQDVWVKETFGPTLRSPFTDLAVFRAAEAWSRHCRALGARPDKSILTEAAGRWLPAAVTGRKGKVAYDGVWMRAYARNAEHIADALERTGDVLSYVGLSPEWLIRRAEALAAWKPVSDREVLAAYSIAVWLLAWGIERRGDVTWADSTGPAYSRLKKKFWNSRPSSATSPKYALAPWARCASKSTKRL